MLNLKGLTGNAQIWKNSDLVPLFHHMSTLPLNGTFKPNVIFLVTQKAVKIERRLNTLYFWNRS